ncbi:FAD-dependent oxidoreductase [Sunxiuqinia sp. A32]|uniref:FAD-dependent oxidoreductase n=1 Tax=Sunxiuqinia sp. A32 TaxID=3461496 RepID=UPI0040453F19
MKRRDFIYQSAAGTAFLTIGGLKAFSNSADETKKQFGFQSARQIPVAYVVDVLVVGGATAGVAAAIQAKQNGALTFLVAQEPYLGEDLCGTFRLWREDSNYQTELEEKIFGEGLPTPMHIKHTLDQELIKNKIDFLYSSYVTDVVHDDQNQLAGVVISNRSGRQAILAKNIIDATPRGLVARLNNVSFGKYPSGEQKFNFTVVGNDIKKRDGISAKIQSEIIQIKDKEYKAIEYSITIPMPDGSWSSFANAEQVARDLVWDSNQVESADLLFQVPPDRMSGQKRWTKPEIDSEKISMKVFQPRKKKNLFVLSGSACLSDQAAENLLKPGKLIRIGERIGEAAAIVSSQRNEIQNPKIKGIPQANMVTGNVGELLEGLRPYLNQGRIIAEDTSLPVLGHWDVIVMGGGTAGAPAALGSSRNNAKTLVLDYMHGMGGIGTLGMVGRYYHGYREGFTNEVDAGVRSLGDNNPRQKERLDEWVFDWKTEWFRSEIRKNGGEIWFGVIGCGTYVEDKKVKGIVVATPMGKGVVLGHTIIDSTGSADIAIAAGASYDYTDADTLAVQGTGMPYKNPDDFYNNTDWTFTNDSDMLDVWRTFVVGKEKFKDQFDIGKLVQTRERRRMVGDFTISVLDVYNGRTYPDTISIHKSSFDTHGFTVDPYFALKPPAHSGVDVIAYVPLRSLLPKGLDNIAVTGLGASAHRDAMPVIRMQPCLQNQGYAVGMAAAMVSKNGKQIRNVDIKNLQHKLVEIGSLIPEVITYKDNFPPKLEQIQNAAKTVVNNLEGLEILLWNRESGITALKDHYHLSNNAEHKLVYARILGMFGEEDGSNELLKAVSELEEWDEGWNYRGMGQFGKSMSYIDSLIIALGNCKNPEAIPAIEKMAQKLTRDSYFSHFRAVAIALETIASEEGVKIIYDLLQIEGIQGHAMTDIQKALRITPANSTDTSTRNNSLRELILARALYKCGDFNGIGNQILLEYSKDLRGHYFRHASGVLQKYGKEKRPGIEL